MERGKHLLIDCRNVSREVCLNDGRMLEAMAHGCPVITRPVNALAELCGGACVGLVDTTPESIAAAILPMLEDGELRAGLVRAGLERAKAFDSQAFADEVAGAIASVMPLTRRATSGAGRPA